MASKTCKCGKPCETSDGYCRECRATYQRDYQATKEGRAEAKGRKEGAEAMRRALATSFDQYGTCGNFSGSEIRDLILQAKAPQAE